MALLTLISLGIQATNLVRGLRSAPSGVPQRQFVTRSVRIKNDCSESISVTMEYYTCGVDGRWEWKRWDSKKNAWKSGETKRLTDDGQDVHAAKIKLLFTTESGIRSDKVEFNLASEPYLAPERQTAVIGCSQPTELFETKDVVIENATEEPIEIGIRWTKKPTASYSSSYDWNTDSGYVLEPGERGRLRQSSYRGNEVIHAAKVCICCTGKLTKRSNIDEWKKSQSKSFDSTTRYGPEHVVCGQKYGATERSEWVYVCKW